MSDYAEPELLEAAPLQLSKVKLTRNAKGFMQFETTVVEGFDQMELDRIKAAAVALARDLEREFPDAG